MNIVLAQLNYTVGDLRGNADKIIGALAANADADLVVFSELALTGYYPMDLILRPDFIAAMERHLARIMAATQHIRAAAVVGYVARNASQVGKPYFNALGVFSAGAQLAEYHKQLLPTYNIFDESRHFEPGAGTGTLDFRGVKLGFLICEDGWPAYSPLYAKNPVADLAALAVDAIVSINASPADTGKAELREGLFRQLAKRYQRPIIYVNQVGANDSIVYDGHSFFCDRNGRIRARLPGYAEAIAAVTIAPGTEQDGKIAPLPASFEEMAYRQILLGLRDYVRKCGFSSVVVGSSGGIDSTLTLALARDALGADNVTAITMPSTYSSAGSVLDSQTLCERLGVHLITHPIGALFNQYRSDFGGAFGEEASRLTQENIQARIRGAILMEFSNQFGALVLSTGNKSELAVGYATLYGDMNGGINLIGDLYKMEVYAVSRYVNRLAGSEIIPAAILDKEPSAELSPNQKDSDSLPPYPVLDAVLKLYIEHDLMDSDQADAQRRILADNEFTDIAKICRLVDNAEFKRKQAPPIVRVHQRAFGFGRQLPIVQRYREKDDA
ncbi:MAG: NAD+ synthase [Sulfuricella sp.]